MQQLERAKSDEVTPLLPCKETVTTQKEKSSFKAVFNILLNEFCQRFSYFSLQSTLILYLTQELLYKDDIATIIFHTYLMVCFFTPLFGGLISDLLLGTFKTILYLSLIYIGGNILITIASIPNFIPMRVNRDNED
ncbi:solute carrier family 15 member 1-like [Centruroides sculpturatus]|uniref:solute carrier family 15 member 1-like n=1 Tax=Centruroides sculpturatus TaxID=218467 RepID=UPI000C6D9B77|nr:solute carrier family 15 member 1-like [Centruroides sculpturatus]